MNAKHVKCKSVCSKVHLVCMCDAWLIHEQGTQGAKCIKHTTNDQNMINMNNYGDPQKLVFISPKQWENVIWAFYQTLRVHTLHMYVKQCMNIWKTCINTCYFCHMGPTSKENQHLKQNPIKKIDKN